MTSGYPVEDPPNVLHGGCWGCKSNEYRMGEAKGKYGLYHIRSAMGCTAQIDKTLVVYDVYPKFWIVEQRNLQGKLETIVVPKLYEPCHLVIEAGRLDHSFDTLLLAEPYAACLPQRPDKAAASEALVTLHAATTVFNLAPNTEHLKAMREAGQRVWKLLYPL